MIDLFLLAPFGPGSFGWLPDRSMLAPVWPAALKVLARLHRDR
jgi:hypothetical protein